MHRDGRFGYLYNQVWLFPYALRRFPWQTLPCHILISRFFTGGPVPRFVPAILSEARYAQEGGAVAGVLLRFNGHMRLKSGE